MTEKTEKTMTDETMTEDTRQTARRGPARKVLSHLWRHLFLYFFLAVQAVFLLWMIAGGKSNHCDVGTQADQGACTVGNGIGLALVFGLWIGTDVILGIGRIIVKLSRHRKAA